MPTVDLCLSREAGRLLERLKQSLTPSELGYRIQGFAAHILLRLGAQVLQVNNQGHPDIVARSEGGLLRAEVEADFGGNRGRLLTPADLDAIQPRTLLDHGYFLLADCGYFPRWLVVPVDRLNLRREVEASPAVLLALADPAVSGNWTSEFVSMIVRNRERLESLTFKRLRESALTGGAV